MPIPQLDPALDVPEAQVPVLETGAGHRHRPTGSDSVARPALVLAAGETSQTQPDLRADPLVPGGIALSSTQEPVAHQADPAQDTSIPEEAIKGAKILIVDDDEAVTAFLERVLVKHGYTRVTCTTNPRNALSAFSEIQPDLILLDLRMPDLDGFAVLEALEPHIAGDDYLPTLILTGDLSQQTRRRALAAGAKDFLTKPVDFLELLLRISNLLENRFLHLRLRQQNESLEAQVRDRTRELEEARIETLERLARTAEYRDDNTRWHTERVGIRSALLARTLGLPHEEVQLIRRAAPLHDLGKIGIPDSILLKPASLTPAEATIMRTHTTIGAQILSGSRFALLNLAAEIALTHHERWDGTGYPQGLAGEEIPLAARIVSVADFFDALAHDRPYRPAWSIDAITAEIARQRGHQFDPTVAEAFLDLLGHDPRAQTPIPANSRPSERA